MLQQQGITLAGGGLSGLSLALELVRRPAFADMPITIIDRDGKNHNDRTWSFWATPDEPLPPVIFRKWPKAHFYSSTLERAMDMGAYQYHTVRGIDFYTWAKGELSAYPQVRFVQANIERIDATTGQVYTDQGIFEGQYVFNSAFLQQSILPKPSDLYPETPFSQPKLTANGAFNNGRHTLLLQHFEGWTIRTAQPVFDPEVITFMDFRIEQGGETRFVYVLPFDAHTALIEFTAFSPALYDKTQYETALLDYIARFLKIEHYTVESREFGVIPMTDYPFTPLHDNRLIHIGTAAGFVKASSGYAFKRTLRKMKALADTWEYTGEPTIASTRTHFKYRLYDSILLKVLGGDGGMGSIVFSRLFRTFPAHFVFRFLDEETTLPEDFRVINSQASMTFIRAAMSRLPVLSNI
jgi:lycopene beta-cyclase